jgi:hypothetical protein
MRMLYASRCPLRSTLSPYAPWTPDESYLEDGGGGAFDSHGTQ